ncbi:hypothetical protein GCM10009661_49380 [Catellatospora chokoriensis]|uniref:Uncharacterized protein n=1 Tax=Catellatospora chokoriensis TaxID=310353 RepID=A0A8J3NVB5_9ACTN|nr:hypothetical protein Cch02nite_72070 [Catellatospora chokoriensis]
MWLGGCPAVTGSGTTGHAAGGAIFTEVSSGQQHRLDGDHGGQQHGLGQPNDSAVLGRQLVIGWLHRGRAKPIPTLLALAKRMNLTQ